MGKKILKHVKGTWVAVLLVAFMYGNPVQAVEITEEFNLSVVNSPLQSKFKEKADLITDSLLIEESNAAIKEIGDTWKANTVEDVKKEIKRQQELGLKAYVVQWGDTLNVLAEATSLNVEDIAKKNNLSKENHYELLTGDILTAVLNQNETSVDKEKEAPIQGSNQIPNKLEGESKPTVEETPTLTTTVEESTTILVEPTTEETTVEETITTMVVEPTTEESTTVEETTTMMVEPTTIEETTKVEETTTILVEPTTEVSTTVEVTSTTTVVEPTTEESTTVEETTTTMVVEPTTTEELTTTTEPTTTSEVTNTTAVEPTTTSEVTTTTLEPTTTEPTTTSEVTTTTLEPTTTEPTTTSEVTTTTLEPTTTETTTTMVVEPTTTEELTTTTEPTTTSEVTTTTLEPTTTEPTTTSEVTTTTLEPTTTETTTTEVVTTTTVEETTTEPTTTSEVTTTTVEPTTTETTTVEPTTTEEVTTTTVEETTVADYTNVEKYIADVKSSFNNIINQVRELNGFQALTINPELDLVAQARSEDNLVRGMSHFNEDGSRRIADEIAKVNYQTTSYPVTENLAGNGIIIPNTGAPLNYADIFGNPEDYAESIVNGWYMDINNYPGDTSNDSRGHRKQFFVPFWEETGWGVAIQQSPYDNNTIKVIAQITQVFANPNDATADLVQPNLADFDLTNPAEVEKYNRLTLQYAHDFKARINAINYYTYYYARDTMTVPTHALPSYEAYIQEQIELDKDSSGNLTDRGLQDRINEYNQHQSLITSGQVNPVELNNYESHQNYTGLGVQATTMMASMMASSNAVATDETTQSSSIETSETILAPVAEVTETIGVVTTEPVTELTTMPIVEPGSESTEAPVIPVTETASFTEVPVETTETVTVE